LRRVHWIPLAAILVLSFGLNARMAANPRSAYQSADERSYGKLAVDIADNHHYGGASTKMREPLHWPPGAPVLFAVGYKLFGSENEAKTLDIRSAYWEQAAFTTGTTALAVRRRTGPWWYAASGALFGLAILTRTDLLPVPFLIAGIGGLIVLIRQRSLREALLRWGMVAIAAAIVLAPWTIYASREEGRFIPVTKGSAAALFVGTYLPGGGTTIGMKEHLENQLRAKHPEYKDLKTYKIPAADALELFAAKHPDLPRDQALSKEAKKNLIHYSTTQPVAFARMQWAKAKRMWFFYYRGGGVHYISTPMRIWQVLLVIGCSLGLLAGIIRRRDPLLAAAALTVAFSTFVHTIVVSQARYNVPLMPLLISAGVAGWFLALARRPDRSQAPATLSEWNSDESESGTAKTRVAPAS
jgi:4-amino-4-deoxy-L-arabinose transferase-like glycosyltransferase